MDSLGEDEGHDGRLREFYHTNELRVDPIQVQREQTIYS